MAIPKKLQHTVIYIINIIAYLKNIMADLLEDKMNLNSILKNALNVIINIFTGWLTFWIFFYSWFFITDRKDAEAESFVPVGYAMFIIGIPAIIIFRIVKLIRKENKKDYWIYNILPMLATLIIMILWCVLSRMNTL